MVAPVLKMIVMKRPKIRINLAIISDCSSKNFFSLLGTKYCRRLSPSKAITRSDRSSGFLRRKKSNRRKRGSFERVGDLVEITPRLGVKAAAIGIKDANHAPQVAAKFDLLTGP